MLQIQYNKDTNCAYVLLPFKRNQDVVGIRSIAGHLVIGVVDGWSNAKYLPETAGRSAAEFVLMQYPKKFLSLRDGSLSNRGQKAAEATDKALLQKFPAHVASVAAFLFYTKELTEIISISTIYIFLWDGKKWYKPKEIGDYSLPYPKYPSDAWSFFGRGELKGDPMYTLKVDALTCSSTTPILVATDGIDDVLSLEDINRITEIAPEGKLLDTILQEIQKRGTQKDDISLLLRDGRG